MAESLAKKKCKSDGIRRDVLALLKCRIIS